MDANNHYNSINYKGEKMIKIINHKAWLLVNGNYIRLGIIIKQDKQNKQKGK